MKPSPQSSRVEGLKQVLFEKRSHSGGARSLSWQRDLSSALSLWYFLLRAYTHVHDVCVCILLLAKYEYYSS